MRHWAFIFVTCLTFAAGCGEGTDFSIFVEFPDDAALEQTSLLRVYAIDCGQPAGCERLMSSEALPEDEGYSVDKMMEIDPHKDAAAGPRLDNVGPGRRLFYAEAEDAEGVIILVGCEDVQAGGGGVQKVSIVLTPTKRECVTDEDCDDEAYCTGDERCEKGRCVTTSRDCGDDDICTQDLCNEELDRCENPWVTEAPEEEGPVGNSTCQDGLDNDCDELTDLDDPECKPCTSDGDCDDQNECTTNSCVESQCENANLPAGTPCQDDGAYCNGAEECNGHGFCVSGGNPCPQAACNHCQEETDSCYDPPGTSCDDAQYCNGEDTCDGLGTCNHSGDPCLDTECNHCQESTDSCYDPIGTPCSDDGQYCTGLEGCDGAGRCVSAGDPCPDTECNHCNEDAKNCHDSTDTPCGDGSDTFCTDPDTCDGGGSCRQNHDPPGTSCDDAQYCNGEDTCDGLGTCNHSGDPCLDTECNHCQESTDSCHDPIGTPCSDDGQYCTGFEECDGAGHCVSAGNPCDPETECNHCNEDDDNCRDPAGTSCDDALYCNGADMCDGTGTCEQAGNPCHPETECNHCNEDDDNCRDPAGTSCGDGSDTFCTDPDTCDGGGSCRQNHEPDGAFCDDDLYCRVNEVCTSGACLGQDRDCSHLDDICQVGVCNEGTDTCEQVAAPNGTACADDLFCTVDEDCLNGACAGSSPRDCSDGDDCTNDVCNESLNQCDHAWQPRPEIVDVCGDGIDNDCDRLVDGCCLGDGTFTTKVDYSIELLLPCGITTGDFDADGILDLAVVTRGSDRMSILLGYGHEGQGDGTFATKTDYTTGNGPDSVTAGDFNADGILDLAVANRYSNNLSILLGNGSGGRGDGTFATKVDYPTETAPMSVTTGDFNSDGILDLAVANGGSNNLMSVLLGNGSGGRGDGTFAAKVNYSSGGYPNAITTGDFDADGILDLAVTNDFPNNLLGILLGNGSDGRGDGTFASNVNYTTEDGPINVTTGDFNSDGILDLAVTNRGSNSVSIFLGNGSGGRGSGTFAGKVDYPTRSEPESVTTGDFNADGILDLAVMNARSDNLSILLGNGSDGRGDGTFAVKVDYTAGNGPMGAATGDFNADGIIDLAVSNSDWNDLSIFLGNGSGGRGYGTFATKADYPAGDGPMNVTTGDFNSDGILDLAVANRISNNLSILLGHGSGGHGDSTFAAKVDYPTGIAPTNVTAGDFNSDGILDLAVMNQDSNNLSILLGYGNDGLGNGTFATKVDYPTGTTPMSVTSGDFNSDGILDLAVINQGSNNLSILLGHGNDGRGNGTFAAKVDYPTGTAPMSVTTGDFDADGILDLAVVNQGSNNLSIFRGNGGGGQGDGTFAAKVDYMAGVGPTSVATGDFNADGILDLVVVNNSSNNASILLGNGNGGQGNGTFTAKVDYPTGDGPESVTTGDFDADGILDLAVANRISNDLSILWGNGSDGQGDGTFTAKANYPTGSDPRSVTTGDLNSDGILDLVVANDSSDDVSILMGMGECLAPL